MSDIVVPGYLAAMVRRVPPADAAVVAGSTPVVSFGEPRRAVAATLGINPSTAEFIHHGQMLAGSAGWRHWIPCKLSSAIC